MCRASNTSEAHGKTIMSLMEQQCFSVYSHVWEERFGSFGVFSQIFSRNLKWQT